MDGEILPLIFPGSRIPGRFDKRVISFCSAPPKCGPRSGVYSVGGLCRGQGTRQDVDCTAYSQRKFRGQDKAID